MHIIHRYLDNNYIDMPSIMHEPDLPFMFLWGGRATGKTYGALKECAKYYELTGDRFLYLRRTDKQLSMCANMNTNPFKPINNDTGRLICPGTVKNVGRGFFRGEVDDNNELKLTEDLYGYMASLSTIGNIRGIDFSDVWCVVYDEFMKMPNERNMKNEGRSFADMYESINRNREFGGKDALKVVCLSNANDLANDIFIYYDLVARAEWMIKKDRYQYLDYGRGIALLRFDDSKISEQKKNTALYRMLGEDSSYSKMSLGNKFKETDIPTIKSVNIKEFKPFANISGLTFYEHKSDNIYYITTFKSGTYEKYDDSDIDKKRFCRKYMSLWASHMNEHIFFDSYQTLRVFESIFLE